MIRRSSLASLVLVAFALAIPGAAEAAGGDVQVGAVTPGGDLNINGDSGNNDIIVTQNADGTITVTGQNGTTVNGQASVTTGQRVTGKVKIKTRGGDDDVTVDGLDVEDLTIDDELGNNDVTVKNTKVKDKLKIKAGGGTILIKDSNWGRRDIRVGTSTLTPANLAGSGGAGQVGTPPSGGGGGGENSGDRAGPNVPQTPMGTVVGPQVEGLPKAKIPTGSKGGGPKGGSYGKGKGYK